VVTLLFGRLNKSRRSFCTRTAICLNKRPIAVNGVSAFMVFPRRDVELDAELKCDATIHTDVHRHPVWPSVGCLT
jgi:hypothetical protein